MGATAGQALFGSKFRVGAARGEVLDFDGRAVIATIHPSADTVTDILDGFRERAGMKTAPLTPVG